MAKLNRSPELVEPKATEGERRLQVYASVMTVDWMFHCYMLQCMDGTYYVGHTDNLDTRFAQHQSGFFTGHTFKRRPVVLVWNETFQTREDAKAVEKQIKGWSRAKKEALIAGDWLLVSKLARCRSVTL